jgi:hypothetical protein
MPETIQIDPNTGERITASSAIQIDPNTGERVSVPHPEAAIGREAALGFLGSAFPETQHPLTDMAKSMQPDMTSGWTYIDPTGIGRAVYGVGKGIIRAGREILPVLPKLTPGGGMGTTITPEEAETAAHGAGGLAGYAAQATLLGRQGERAPVEKVTNPEPVVINEQLGQAMQAYLDKANTAIGKEIGKHVDNIAAAVDDPVRNPVPPIDATSKVQALKEGFEAYDKTLTDMNLKPDQAIKKTVEEAIQSPRWSWAQAKDVRTALMDMQRKAGTRMSAAVNKAIGELTSDLRNTAKNAGVEADFDAYNTLAKQRAYIKEQFLNNVLNASSGTDVMSALTGSKEGPVKINLPALKAYGIDPRVVTDAIQFSKRLGGKGGWLGGWAPRSVGAHAAMALGVPYAVGWFGTDLVQQAMRRAGTAPTGPTETAVVAGQRIAQGRMPIPPSEVATPKEVPVEPFTPSAIAPSGSPARRPLALPPVPIAEAAPEAPVVAPEPPPPPTKLVQEASRRLALNKLKNALNKNEPLSSDQTEWLKSKGVDLDKQGALGAAHRVIQGELAKLTGKGVKAKEGPIPPVPKAKPPEEGGAAPVTQSTPPAASTLKTPVEQPAAPATSETIHYDTATQAERDAAKAAYAKKVEAQIASRPATVKAPKPSAIEQKAPKTSALGEVPPVTTFEPSAVEPSPMRTFRIGRGAHGQVVVEFPDALHADLYAFAGRMSKHFSGKARQSADWVKNERPRLANALGVSPDQVQRLSLNYREQIGAAIKKPFPEGEKYLAPRIPEASIRMAAQPPKEK